MSVSERLPDQRQAWNLAHQESDPGTKAASTPLNISPRTVECRFALQKALGTASFFAVNTVRDLMRKMEHTLDDAISA